MRLRSSEIAIVAALSALFVSAALACETETLAERKGRMWVGDPLSRIDIEMPKAQEKSNQLRFPSPEMWASISPKLLEGDQIHPFEFRTDPNTDNYWGYGGFLLVRDDCIVDEYVAWYDN